MAAFRSILPRINKDVDIILLQNGIFKVYDELSSLLVNNNINFNIVCASTTHGVTRVSKSEIYHAGFGTTVIGDLKTSSLATFPNSSIKLEPSVAADATETRSSQLVQHLRAAWSPLDVQVVHGDLLRKRLLLKIIVNAAINPIAAVLNQKNGALASPHAVALIRSCCKEFVVVFPEVGPLEDAVQEVMKVVHRTADNYNSMCTDLRSGRGVTEIDYITGYVLDAAAKQGIDVPTHRALYGLVKVKEELASAP